MSDMLVKLYDLPSITPNIKELQEKGILIKRALSPDKHLILEFVKNEFNQTWANECDIAFSNKPISCFIAVKDKAIIGFGCYDATAPNYFGPTGLKEEFRGLGVGQAILSECLLSMKNNGYGYAIIGWAGEAAGFYKKTVGAIPIEKSSPGIYERLVRME